MQRLKGPQGEPLTVRPRFLIVAPGLQVAAEQLLATLAATKASDVNPFAGALELIVEPGLTNPTAWSLAADPALHDSLVLGFLDSQRTPQIENNDGWETLSVEWRLWWPMDAAFTGTASRFLNPGA